MSVLIDSSAVIAFLHRKDRRHGDAKDLLGPVLAGEHGAPGVTDDIVDEVLAFLVARGATRAHLDKAIAFLVGDGEEPGQVVLHRVGPDHFAEALRLVRRHRDRKLSFTDCTSLAVISSVGMEGIVTFDAGFEGLVGTVERGLD